MKRILKSVYTKYINHKNDTFIDNRYIKELNAMKGPNYHAKKIPEKLKREYLDYYASFGFNNVPLDWVEYIYSVQNEFNVGYIPDTLYHKFIDPYFPFTKYEVADKFLQPFILKDIVDYPETLVANVNGLYITPDMNTLNLDDVLQLVSSSDEFIIKPTVYNGAGINVRLIKKGDDVKSMILNQYKKDFIIQKKLDQLPLMAEFNESSVNTVRILTMIINGEVHVLCAQLRIGHPGSVVDNSSNSNDNYYVFINENGQLAANGCNLYSDSTYRTKKGKLFSDFCIPKFREMVDISKKGHIRLSKHKLIAWDFALDKNGKITVLEYNFKLHPIIIYEVIAGPLFGNHLDCILKEAAEYKAMRDKYGVSLPFI